jgi:hypothetical protein
MERKLRIISRKGAKAQSKKHNKIASLLSSAGVNSGRAYKLTRTSENFCFCISITGLCFPDPDEQQIPGSLRLRSFA